MTDVEEYRLTPDQAKILNDQIKTTIQELEDLLSEFISGEGWLALGYETAWDWWNKEIGERRLGAPKRKVLTLQFHKEGVSNKKIAKALGVNRATVQGDLRETSAKNSTVPVTSSNEVWVWDEAPIEPTEILSPEPETWNGQTAEEIYDELQDFLEANRSTLEPTVPYDLTPDNAISLAIESSSGWMELAVNVSSRREFSPNMKAKMRIEIDIMRDMLNKIEENL